MKSNVIFYEDKSQSYFNLFNPAFCGHLMRICISEYENNSKKKMPFSLSFLILPLLLHKELRDSIDHNTNLHTWTFENYHKLTDFDKNVKDRIDITKSTLIYLLQTDSLAIDKDATLRILNYRQPTTFSSDDLELREFYKKSRYLGRWFTHTDDLPTIFSLLGVRP